MWDGFRLTWRECGRRIGPLTSIPDLEVLGTPLPMGEGECWYINFNLPHRIHNRGTTDRVHLVIDCVLNDPP